MNCDFYMQRWENGSWGEAVNLMDRFKGLIVLEVKGMSNKGEVKNIYIERYAEADKLRVYMPDKVARQSTDIVILLAFVGVNRRDIYDAFIDYVSGHRIKYWATDRNREVEMFQQKAIEIEDDVLKGDVPYMVVPVKFTNVKGYTANHV